MPCLNRFDFMTALAVCTLSSLSNPMLYAQSHDSSNQLEKYVDSHAVAGVVTLVASKDAILDIDTAGWADIAAGKRMQEDTLFWIASQSKPMTATALMMLVDQGKVELDAPVEKYLPEFKGRWVIAEKADDHQLLKRPARPITVRDILSHMSGLPFRVAIEQPTLDVFPLSDRVVGYTMVPLDTEPGTAYQYSNVGINTAGRLIEVVSGMPYDKYMDEMLFHPLGMKETTFWPSAEQEQRIAKSYQPNAEKNNLVEVRISQLRYPLSDREHRFAMPAGGLFSTARDVARFCQMVLNNGELDGKRYLSAESVKTMTARHTPKEIPQGYALGWQTDGEGFGHGGAQATNMHIDPSRGLVTIYMVQHAGFPLDGKDAMGVFRNWSRSAFAK